jgi:hypothetical protein
MADGTEQVAEEVNHLGMSDEDFLKAGPPDMPVETTPEVPEVETAVDTDTPTAGTEAGEATESERDVEEPGEANGSETTLDDEDASTAEGTGKAPTQKPEPTSEKVAEATPIDYKAQYEKLLTPFKANGRDIQVNSIDDARSLMQMGANYNKKMAGLKPSLKILKLLENNGLLDESKLGFLIDLDKKDPQAINKLVKDSGLSPMDLDTDKADEYKPKIRTVDEREIDLDTVLSDIENTSTYTRTLSVVSKEWDGPSKQVIAGQPQLLKVINDHMSSGVYDLINKEVESERVFGRLAGLSDIEAYRKVGDSIQARGGFNHLGSSQGQSGNAAPVVVIPKPKVDNGALKDKRRAAGSTPAAAPAVVKDFNPLQMSDADFAKMAVPLFK